MSVFVSSFVLFLVICQCYGDSNTYTTKYDGIDLDQILSSDRLLNGYVSCLLDKGPCTPDGKELKQNLPDAIQDDCSKCTDKQREGADKVMHFIIDHRPDDWKKLEEKLAVSSNGILEKGSFRKKRDNACIVNRAFRKKEIARQFHETCSRRYVILKKPYKYNSDGTYKLKYLTTKEPVAKSASKEDSNESGSYDDDADDEDDEINKDNYTKKDAPA